MYKHQLSIQLHQAFLQEARKDPITGDDIQAGDTVVICAGCKSAFLEGSWEYLGRQHCDQQETLAQIPEKLRLTLTRRIEKLLFSAETHEGNVTLVVGVPAGMIGFMLMLLSAMKALPSVVLSAALPILIIIPLIVHFFTTKGIEAKETAFFIKKGFGRRIKLPIKDIKRIELAFFTNLKFDHVRIKNFAGEKYEESYESYFSTPPILRIVSTSQIHEINLSEYDFNKNRSEIIVFFEKLSHILPILLCSNNTTLIEEFETQIPQSTIIKDKEGVNRFNLLLQTFKV